MGCDIHFYVEVNRGYSSSPDWLSVPAPFGIDDYWDRCHRPEWFPGRSYYAFARLADVRNYGAEPVEVVIPPRGVPDNISDYTRREYESDDFHSASWLTLPELREHFADLPQIAKILPILEALDPTEPERVRVVFWFDN